jgi:glycerate kinase
MQNINNVCINKFGVDGNKLIGGGAAGGLGAGSVIFLNAVLKKGIDMLFKITNF